MKPFKRHALAAICFSLLTSCVANAQQEQPEQPPEEEQIFDEAQPVIEDNVAPGEQLPAEEEGEIPSVLPVGTPLPESAGVIEALPEPIIGYDLRPYNAKQPELIAFFQGQAEPESVFIGGQSFPLHNPKRVRTFYESEQFPTIWTQDDQFTPRLEQLQRLLKTAPEDALPPARYRNSLIQALQAHQDYHDIIPYEILLTDAYLTLAGDLANGLVNPKKTQPEWNAPKVSDEALAELLAHSVVRNELESGIRSLNAGNPRYQILRNRYNAIRGNTPVTQGAPFPNITLRPGMKSKAVPILRQKLGVPGDGNVYDPELVEAVKAYQTSLGMKADGIVGSGTRATLNATHKAIANDLMINMERQRWMPQELGNAYILVNIPSFVVKMYQNNQEVYSSKAVVGRKDRQTPAFTNKMRHVVMSPTWTVPPTIMRKDKLARLRSNPGAFDGNFEVVTPGGRVVRPSAVNWSSVNPANYALRQKPGRRNALGQVKFLFPNKHAIYLHDTPSKSLFNKSVRAFSSGCIRLQKPEEFAQILLKNTNWSNKRIKSAMNQSREQWVNTPQEVPIYLVYWTLWSTPKGQIQVAKDIYGKDATLLRQYKAALN